MNLIVCECDVILVNGVPLLDANLIRSRACLCSYQLLQVADCVVLVALDTDLLAETVVENDLNHAVAMATKETSLMQRTDLHVT